MRSAQRCGDCPRAFDVFDRHRSTAERRTTSPICERAPTGLKARRPDVVLCMTDPPLVGDIAYLIAHRFGDR